MLDSGFSDGWFPVDSSSLPPFLDPRVKADIVRCQQSVMAKSLDLENGKHCHLSADDPLPFQTLSRLGAGGYGQVDKIESKVTFKQYALKTINRRAAFGYKSKEAMKEFLLEIGRMRKLNHPHLVRYVGSYTDKNNLGLVMAPVADCDLAAYLERACVEASMLPAIRTSFGCLATGLSYLHDCQIKHRDIKPGNILVHNSNVLIADFGLSHDFLDTTSGVTPASPRYCAPEVAKYGKRNWSQDVWSLGCVFLEMVATLHGNNINWLEDFYGNVGTCETYFHENPAATELLIQQWEQSWSREDRRPLVWIRKMLAVDWRARPQTAEILACITDGGMWMYYCGSCCNPFSSDGPSDKRDSIASLFDEMKTEFTYQASRINTMMEAESPCPEASRIRARKPPAFKHRLITTSDITSDGLPEKSIPALVPKSKWSSPPHNDQTSASDTNFKISQTTSNATHHPQTRQIGDGNNGEGDWSAYNPALSPDRNRQSSALREGRICTDTATEYSNRPPSPEATTDNTLGDDQLKTTSTELSVPLHSRRVLSDPNSKDTMEPTRAVTGSERSKPIKTAKAEGGLHNKSPSQTSLLIEYFEAGKNRGKSPSRPSVRVRVLPSSRKGKSKANSDHLQSAQTSRKPSHTQRVSLDCVRDETSSEESPRKLWNMQFSPNHFPSSAAPVFGDSLSQSIGVASVIVTLAEWDPFYKPIPVRMKLPIVVDYCTSLLIRHGTEDVFSPRFEHDEEPPDELLLLFNSLIATFDSPPNYPDLASPDEKKELASEISALQLLFFYFDTRKSRLLPNSAVAKLTLLADTADAIDAEAANSIILNIRSPRRDVVIYLLAFINLMEVKLNNMAHLTRMFCPIFLSPWKYGEIAFRIFRYLVGNSFYYLSHTSTVEGQRLRQLRREKLN